MSTSVYDRLQSKHDPTFEYKFGTKCANERTFMFPKPDISDILNFRANVLKKGNQKSGSHPTTLK